MRRKTRPIRIRWTFNYQSRTATTPTIRGFADTLIEDVAFNIQERHWQQVGNRLQRMIAIDVRKEIAHMARMYKQLTLGIGADRSGLHGTLTSVAEQANDFAGNTSMRLNSGPWANWARRKPSYLARKERVRGHKRWFEYDGVLSGPGGLGTAKTWIDAYGPVTVSVRRTGVQNRSGSSRIVRTRKPRRLGSTPHELRLHLATVRVSAFGDITSRMLPAIRTGNIQDVAPDGRKAGLIDQFPEQIARNLAGSAKGKNFVPYRHTVEPFLGFVLKRAIPNAVMRRLQEGLSDRRLAARAIA